jgi:hypothetical protein
MPFTVAATTCPARRKVGGVIDAPVSLGVRVEMTSPGSKVVNVEIQLRSAASEKSSCDVRLVSSAQRSGELGEQRRMDRSLESRLANVVRY